MAKQWLQKARASMESKGTVGEFTRKARAKGMSVQEYASDVVDKYKGNAATPAQKKLLKQAMFAKTMKKIAGKK
jgi:hypothetical protein